MAPNSCWGIEIGANALKAIKLELDGEKAKIVDYAVIEHAKPLSTPGLDQDAAVRVALGALVAERDLSKSPISVSVPGHSAFARFAKLPPVEPKKVPQIVKFEAVQQIPFPLEEVEWDFQTFQSPDSPDVEVGIFAITKERIGDQLRLFADVGLTPDAVTLSPVAAYNALAYDLEFTEDTPGTIILDVGTTSTDLIVAEAGRVWVRTFPMGGHQFTEKLVEAFKLSYSKAERLKREADKSKHARHIFQALRPAFTDLVQDVQRSIGYYQSLHKDANLTRLIGLGSTFRLPGLRKFLKQQLNVDVYKIEQWKRLEAEESPRAGELQAASLNLATAVGCALQGLELNTIEANLMPVSVIRQEVWRRKTKWFGAAAGLAACGAGVMFLRPFLDSTAAAANAEPPTIGSAVRLAQQEGNRAEEAGVVGGAGPDFTAANLLKLLDDSDVHTHLVADVSQMLVDVRTAGAPFMLESMRTTYLPPGTPITGAAAGNQGNQGNQGGGRDGFDDRGGGGFDDAGGGAGGPAYVRVDLRLTIDTRDPLDVFLRSVVPWVADHMEREGVPYRLVPFSGNAQWDLTDAAAPAPDEQGRDPGRDPGRGPGRDPGRDGRGGDRTGGGGGPGGGAAEVIIDLDRDAPLILNTASGRPAAFDLYFYAELIDPNAVEASSETDGVDEEAF
ncbi:MAG: type IV pilus assembly protein PilM [Planctomycetota bacterium]